MKWKNMLNYMRKIWNEKIKMQSSSFDNCVHVFSIEILILFYPELQQINIAEIKNKLNDLFDELKKFKVQQILVLEYKKTDDHKTMRKIFHPSAKLLANELNIDKSFKSMHKSF